MIRQTFEELKLTQRLPTAPGVGMRILEITRGEDYSAADISHAIMADSALTGRLLKIANSALSSPGQAITTVPEATMRLGVRSVRNVALGLSLISANRSGGCDRFEYERYWSRSLARAVAAQAISRVKRVGSPPEAYVLGLLSEIGTLALASVYPREYAALLAAHPDASVAAIGRHEREVFEIDHCEVGACMLEEWGLPSTHTEALLVYETFGRLGTQDERKANGLAGVLWAAQAVAEMIFADEASDAATWSRHAARLADVRAFLELEEGPFAGVCDAISREWQEWNGILQLPKRSPLRYELLAQLAGRAAQAPAAAIPPQAAAGAAMPGRLRVLAVDDDPLSLRLLERTLLQAGHQVTCARGGRDALQLALETSPQVVLADWMMPDLDGLELCRALRRIERGQEMYFLLLTGRDDENRVVEAFEAGVDDYVAKPFNARILMARLKGGQRLIELKAKVEADRQTMIQQVAELGSLARKLRSASLTDPLTELPNRRYIMKRLEHHWDASVRTDGKLSVIVIDIDHFKRVNDAHGHDTGDAVLRETARVLRAALRQGEVIARLGGEEFLVVCPEATLPQARACAERLRLAVERNLIRCAGFQRSVSISLGVAERQPSQANHEALLKAADEAVYVAKSCGRNQVRAAGDTAPARCA